MAWLWCAIGVGGLLLQGQGWWHWPLDEAFPLVHWVAMIQLGFLGRRRAWVLVALLAALEGFYLGEGPVVTMTVALVVFSVQYFLRRHIVVSTLWAQIAWTAVLTLLMQCLYWILRAWVSSHVEWYAYYGPYALLQAVLNGGLVVLFYPILFLKKRNRHSYESLAHG